MDEERILGKIDQLDNYMEEFRSDLPSSLEDYKADKRRYERLFQLCIETMIDISALILKEEGLGTPSDEENIIDKLVDSGIYSEELGDKLKLMKGFRNILVHRYGEIDDRKVFENVERLEDLKEFRKSVMEYLDDKQG